MRVSAPSSQIERERERESKNCLRQESLFGSRGLPIGNLTSQLFANIYLNEFDYFIKHSLRIKNYVRYTDDFVIVSGSEDFLNSLILKIEKYLAVYLKLKLHPDKILVCKYRQGVDFLGYVILPYYKRLRTKTKRRIHTKLKKKVDEYKKGLICESTLTQSLNSYLGVLSHANEFNLREELMNQYWFWLNE